MVDGDQPHGFIRSFGPIEERIRKGAGLFWDAEDAYCEGSHAVRFASLMSKGRMRPGARAIAAVQCMFRRFYANEMCVSRFEIGLRERMPRGCQRFSRDYFQFASECLSLQVTANGVQNAKQLPAIGPDLAALYLRSTTELAGKLVKPTQSWWVGDGSPLGFLEYGENQARTLPESAFALPIGSSDGLKLDFARLPIGNRLVGVWFCRVAERRANLDLLRRLRVNLFRLHSEIESVKYVTHRFLRGRLFDDISSEEAIRLERYLVKSRKLLRRRQRYGVPQEPILLAVQECNELIADGVTPTLLAQIDQVLDWIKAEKLRVFGFLPRIIVKSGGVATVDIFSNISGSTIVNKSVVENSFNKVQSKLGPEVAQFIKAVADEVHKSGNAEAGQVFEAFNEELQKPEPKKSLLRTFWNGLAAALPTLLSLPGAAESALKIFGLGS